MKFMAQRRTDYSLIVYVYEKRHKIRKQFGMKIRIEIDPAISEEEVVIKCSQITETVTDIQRTLTDLGSGKRKISFYKGETEYYLPIEEILFFETSNETVWAHTKDDEFIVKHKLYELEELLPHFFMRISKSSILNTRKVYSIMRNLTSSSKVEFLESKKTVYVSRSYYKALRDKIELEIKN